EDNRYIVYAIEDKRRGRDSSREAIRSSGGQIVIMVYDYVVHRVVNIYPISVGLEKVLHDHLERPIEGRRDTGKRTKVWTNINYDEDKGQTHIVKELEPFIGKKWETAEYYFDISGEPNKPMKVKMVIEDFYREVEDKIIKKVSILSTIFNGSYASLAFLVSAGAILTVIALILFKILGMVAEWRGRVEDKRRNNNSGNSGQGGTTSSPVEEGKRADITRENIGLIHERMGSQSLRFKDILTIVEDGVLKLNSMLPETFTLKNIEGLITHQVIIKDFRRWLRDVRKQKLEDALRGVPLVDFLVIMELVYGLSKEFRYSTPSVVWYHLDKAVRMYREGRKARIAAEIKSDIEATREFLNKSYPIKAGIGGDAAKGGLFNANNFLKGLAEKEDDTEKEKKAKQIKMRNQLRNPSKKYYVTFEDIDDRFNGIYDKNQFIDHWDSLEGGLKQDKFSYLKNKGLSLKTYPDDTGFTIYMRNIFPAIKPLLPSIVSVIAITSYTTFISSISFLLGWGISLGIALGVGLLMVWKGNYNYKKHIGGINKKAKDEISNFYSLFTFFTFAYTSLNYLALYFSYPFIKGLWLTYDPILFGISLILIFIIHSFVILSIWAGAYPILTIFGYYQGKKDRIGKIKGLREALGKISDAKKGFKASLPDKLTNRSNNIWNKLSDTFVDKLIKGKKISPENGAILKNILKSENAGRREKKALIKEAAKDDELQERIQRFISGWLIRAPQGLEWDNLISLTVFPSASSDQVITSFKTLNTIVDGIVPVNWFITTYRHDWDNFVNAQSDKDRAYLKLHTKKIKKNMSLALDETEISEELKDRIVEWVGLHFIRSDKAIAELNEIYEVYKFWAEAAFPDLNEVEIEKKIKEKLQILLIRDAYHEKASEQRAALINWMAKFPFAEATFGDGLYVIKPEWSGEERYGEIKRWFVEQAKDPEFIELYSDKFNGHISDGKKEREAKKKAKEDVRGAMSKKEKAKFFNKISPHTDFIYPEGLFIIVGKTVGQNAACEYARGDIWLPFDSNVSVRFEEAIKIPSALAEFKDNPDVALVLFGEYINTKDYSWISEGLAFAEEAWTQPMQRILDMFGACGFYGHSAFIRADAMKAAGGFLSFYASEDLLLAMRIWQLGLTTSHREYMLFGKGRERGYLASHVPLGRWSEGSGELILGRQMYRTLRSNDLHMGQKMMLVFGLSFYTKKPLVVALSYLYLFSFIFIGLSPFVGYAFALLFGLFGIATSQAINSIGGLYLIEKYGLIKGTWKFIMMFPKLFVLFVAEIVVYAQRLMKGIEGASGFAPSLRGLDLEFPVFRGENNYIWGTTESAEDLKELPSGVILSDAIEGKIKYDAKNMEFVFKGAMSKKEKESLLRLSKDASYKKAVEGLYEKSIANSSRKPLFVMIGAVVVLFGLLWINNLTIAAIGITALALIAPLLLLRLSLRKIILFSTIIFGVFFIMNKAVPVIGIVALLLIVPLLLLIPHFKKVTLHSALRIQMVLAIPMIAFVLAGIWFWGGVGTSLALAGWWAGLFVTLAIYVIGSFRNNNFIVASGLLSFLTVLALATHTQSAIFLLFTFSIFYLSIPFVLLFMPYFGHGRLWDNFKYAFRFHPLQIMERRLNKFIPELKISVTIQDNRFDIVLENFAVSAAKEGIAREAVLKAIADKHLKLKDAEDNEVVISVEDAEIDVKFSSSPVSSPLMNIFKSPVLRFMLVVSLLLFSLFGCDWDLRDLRSGGHVVPMGEVISLAAVFMMVFIMIIISVVKAMIKRAQIIKYEREAEEELEREKNELERKTGYDIEKGLFRKWRFLLGTIKSDEVLKPVVANLNNLVNHFTENQAIEFARIKHVNWYGETSFDEHQREIFIGEKTLQETRLRDHSSSREGISGSSEARYSYRLERKVNSEKLRSFISSLTPENATQKIEELISNVSSPITLNLTFKLDDTSEARRMSLELPKLTDE
ncbi:MAG TPA: hypothetical protein ENH41_01860, partial [Candidatus Omnitrophica bacterium]|nr:hypothetical protein [Candidatus Omnitrophota bacterium]